MTFSQDIMENAKYRKIFNAIAYEHKKFASSYFDKNISTFDEVYEKFLPECLKYLDETFEIAIKLLLEEGIYEYNKELFIGEFQLVDSFISDANILIEQYDIIEEYIKNIELTRNIQRNSRSRWRGGGFGIGGAIKGSIEAGLLNAGRGVIRGIGDSFTDAKDIENVNGKKKELFSNYNFKEIVADAVYNSDVKTGYAICCLMERHNIIRRNIGLINEELLKVKMQNLMEQFSNDRISVHQVLEQSFQWIAENPFSFTYYMCLYVLIGHSEEIAEACDVMGFYNEYMDYKAKYVSRYINKLQSQNQKSIGCIENRISQIDEITRVYDPPQNLQRELYALKFNLNEERQLEEDINAHINKISIYETQITKLIETREINEVWKMIDYKNGYIEWKLTDYFDEVASNLIERKDYPRLERRLLYAREQAELQNYYALYLVSYIQRKWYKKEGKQSKALDMEEILTELSEIGQISACASVGNFYLHGEGGYKKDYLMALDLLSYAAEMNHPLAMSRLGFMYKEGIGVVKNKIVACKWLKIAAHCGEKNAISELKKL